MNTEGQAPDHELERVSRRNFSSIPRAVESFYLLRIEIK